MGYLSLAILSALLLGLWKFGLGIYRDRVSVYVVILISAAAAGFVYLIVGGLQNELAFNLEDVPEGLIGGALNFAGNLLLLKAFQRGKMGVVTGVAATNTLVPLTYSIMLGEQITAMTAAGVVLLLGGLATFYAARIEKNSDEPTSRSGGPIALALGAALFWGLAIVVLDVGSRDSVTGTLAVSQVPQVVISLIVIVAMGRQAFIGVSSRAVSVLVGAGIALGLGNIAFFTAANEGDIGVVSVLASLSPVVTALLAFAILKEKLARMQQLALVIVLIGTALVLA